MRVVWRKSSHKCLYISYFIAVYFLDSPNISNIHRFLNYLVFFMYQPSPLSCKKSILTVKKKKKTKITTFVTFSYFISCKVAISKSKLSTHLFFSPFKSFPFSIFFSKLSSMYQEKCHHLFHFQHLHQGKLKGLCSSDYISLCI